MQGGDKLARSGGRILGLMLELYVGRSELHARNSLCNGQVSGVTDTATIGVGRSVVMMNLFGDGGSRLEGGKEGHQQHYEECSYGLPLFDVDAHH